MRLHWLVLLGGMTGLLAGCGGGPTIAPVSGKVTLDGKPLANAYVTFQPTGDKSSENPGRGSVGITDDEGRFTLKYEGGKSGAVVGTHIVRITPMDPDDSDPNIARGDEETGSPDGIIPPPNAPRRKRMSPPFVPSEWNSESSKQFVVPAEGTDQANFDIVTARGRAKN